MAQRRCGSDTNGGLWAARPANGRRRRGRPTHAVAARDAGQWVRQRHVQELPERRKDRQALVCLSMRAQGGNRDGRARGVARVARSGVQGSKQVDLGSFH
jgi:hypothetical protein